MKILLAVDGSEHSREAMDFVLHGPLAWPGTEFRLVVVVPAPGVEDYVTIRDDGAALACRETSRLLDVGCVAEPEVREGHVANGIVDAAEAFEADLVVVGSRGLGGAKRFLLGSVSQETVKYAPCSVLVARPMAKDKRPFRILVATDGSPSAHSAVEELAALPPPRDTAITVVTVLPLMRAFRADAIQTVGPEWQQRRKAAEADLESAARRLHRLAPGVTTRLCEGVDAAEGILDAADDANADLIVLGHKGKSAIKRFLLGSVSSRVTHHAKCSVWVARRPDHTPSPN